MDYIFNKNDITKENNNIIFIENIIHWDSSNLSWVIWIISWFESFVKLLIIVFPFGISILMTISPKIISDIFVIITAKILYSQQNSIYPIKKPIEQNTKCTTLIILTGRIILLFSSFFDSDKDCPIKFNWRFDIIIIIIENIIPNTDLIDAKIKDIYSPFLLKKYSRQFFSSSLSVFFQIQNLLSLQIKGQIHELQFWQQQKIL